MKWINTKDQLPPLHTYVLVSVAGNPRIRVCYMYEIMIINCATGESEKRVVWSSGTDIIYWAPLPESPEHIITMNVEEDLILLKEQNYVK